MVSFWAELRRRSIFRVTPDSALVFATKANLLIFGVGDVRARLGAAALGTLRRLSFSHASPAVWQAELDQINAHGATMWPSFM